jgi:hypothetical protein
VSDTTPQRHSSEIIEWEGRLWQLLPHTDAPAEDPATWGCKIGEFPRDLLPHGADGRMRRAVERAYEKFTGQPPEFVFSGWGARLTEGERAAHEDRLPR